MGWDDWFKQENKNQEKRERPDADKLVRPPVSKFIKIHNALFRKSAVVSIVPDMNNATVCVELTTGNFKKINYPQNDIEYMLEELSRIDEIFNTTIKEA
jgi:hypothetical protein